MNKYEVVDIKLKIVRGRVSPNEERFSYSTLVEYYYDSQEDKKENNHLTMGISPPTYFFLKEVLKQQLEALERVILHNVKGDDRKFLHDLFIQNNLLRINMIKILAETVDEVVIDGIKPMGQSSYNFSASLYLNNGQRIPNIIPSDAVVIALLAKKKIYILDRVIYEKEKIDQEFQEKFASEKEIDEGDESKKSDIPKNLYT